MSSLALVLSTFYHELFVYNEQRVQGVAVLTLVCFVFFYLHGWFFVLADWYGFLEPYALRRGKHRLPSTDMQRAAITEATIDVFIMKPIVFYLLFPVMAYYVDIDQLHPPPLTWQSWPAWRRMLGDWVLMEAVYSLLFYCAHRLLHAVPFLYKHIHKVHHSFNRSVAFGAQYHHPLESVFGALYVIAGAALVRPTLCTFALYLATRLGETIDAHCGYDVPWRALYLWSDVYPWGSGARMHDYHHSHNRGCYGGGLFGFMDQLLGTDGPFLQFQREKGGKI